MLKYLSEAIDMMNVLYWDLADKNMHKLAHAVNQMLTFSGLTADEKTTIENYKMILLLQNAPQSEMPRKNHLLQLPKERVAEILKAVGISEEDQAIVCKYFFELVEPKPKGEYYPEDLTEEEFKALPKQAQETNTLLVKRDGKIEIVPFELHYKGTCQRVADKLRLARDLCPNMAFRLYLDAKINEMQTGTPEARRLSDALWIENDYKVDMLLSTAMEVYLDEWQNVKGSPTGAIFIRNRSLDSLVESLNEHAAIMEREGPSKYFRQDARASAQLVLRPVDVMTWVADFCLSPQTTIAQCLPNDELMRKGRGAVNLLYINTTKVVSEVSHHRVPRLFLPRSVFTDLVDVYEEGNSIHSMLHEIGHTTGEAADPARRRENPELVFGNEYNALEELRAELFGMYGIIYCYEHGLVSEKVMKAAHYGMLISMISSLKFEPTQAHQKARNMMYHFFQNHGAITTMEEEEEVDQEDGSVVKEKLMKIDLVMEKVKPTVLEFLGKVQDIKSTLDKAACENMRKELCFTDPLMKEVARRTAVSCLGRGLIFPSLIPPSQHSDTAQAQTLAGGWTLKYPESFADLPRFKHPVY